MPHVERRASDFILSKDEGEERKIYVLPHQKPVVEAKERIVVAIGGVQSGKTIAVLMGLANVLARYPDETCFLLAPVFSQLESATLPKMRKVLASYGLYDTSDPKAWNKSRHFLRLTNGAKLRYLSASDPEKLHGVTTPAVMIDEIQEVEERTLDIALQRTAVLKGTVFLSGLIPHPGELIGHWIYDRVYQPSQEGDEDIAVHTFSSADNPFFPRERFEKAKKETPPAMFDAEYRGIFRETMLGNNIFIPSSVDFAQKRWRHRVQYLPTDLYYWIENHTDLLDLPDHKKEDIARAQGSYIREALEDTEETHEQFVAFNKFRTRFGQERYHHDDEKKDYEQDDPEAGLIKYGLEEETRPLLYPDEYEESGLRTLYIGVDPADEGGDLTVTTIRWYDTVLAQLNWVGSTDTSAERLAEIGRSLVQLGYQVRFWIEAPGLGKGVIDQLRKKDYFVQEYWPSDSPPEEPKRYANRKAWLFFKYRNKLLAGEEAIPPVQDLRKQLLEQKYGSTDKQKLIVLKDRNRSPDHADSDIVSNIPTITGMSPEDNVFFI